LKRIIYCQNIQFLFKIFDSILIFKIYTFLTIFDHFSTFLSIFSNFMIISKISIFLSFFDHFLIHFIDFITPIIPNFKILKISQNFKKIYPFSPQILIPKRPVQNNYSWNPRFSAQTLVKIFKKTFILN